MIKYDNLLVVVCVLFLLLELIACLFHLPNIIICFLPVLLFLISIFLIIGIIKQGRKKAKTTVEKESKKETIDIL